MVKKAKRGRKTTRKKTINYDGKRAIEISEAERDDYNPFSEDEKIKLDDKLLEVLREVEEKLREKEEEEKKLQQKGVKGAPPDPSKTGSSNINPPGGDIPLGPGGLEGKESSQTKEERTKIINDYVELLKAKEKWRNLSKIFGYKENQSGLRKILRKITLASKYDEVLKIEGETRAKFNVLLTNEVMNNQSTDQKKQSLRAIFDEIQNKLNERKTMAEKLIGLFRTRKGAIGRAIVGGALVGGGLLIGGVAGMVMLGAAGIVGAVGRFVGVDGLFDTIHSFFSTKEKKGAYALAGMAFYNIKKDQKVDKLVDELVKKENLSPKELDDSFIKYAERLGKNRFWKRIAATVAAVTPFVFKYFTSGKEPTVPTEKSNGVPPTTPEPPKNVPPTTPEPPNETTQIYTAEKGEGIWHLAEKIAKRNIEGFDKLSAKEKLIAIDSIKDEIVKDPSKYGLTKEELIKLPASKGGVGLKLGADLEIDPVKRREFIHKINEILKKRGQTGIQKLTEATKKPL